MGVLHYETTGLIGISRADIYGRSAEEISHGFRIVCLKCGGKGENRIRFSERYGYKIVECQCGNEAVIS